MDRGSACVTNTLATECDIACHGRDIVRCSLRDAFNCLSDLAANGCIICLFLLNVEILRVFTNNDEIYRRLGARDGLDRAYISVQLQTLAECDDWRGVALGSYSRRRDGTEEGTITVRLEGCDSILRESNALLLKCIPTCLVVRKVEPQAERRRECLQNAATGGNDLTANAVTGDKTYDIN